MHNPSYSGLADLRPVIPGVTERDSGSNVFQPDFVVPVQWSAAFRRHHRSREAALLAEVLVSAWQDLDSPNRRVRLDAEARAHRQHARDHKAEHGDCRVISML